MEVTPEGIFPKDTSHIFSEGNHVVTFTARDLSGNSQSCSFRVKVKGSRCLLFTYVVRLFKLETAASPSILGLTNTLRNRRNPFHVSCNGQHPYLSHINVCGFNGMHDFEPLRS